MEREVQYLSVGCSNEDAVGYWFYHNGLDVDFYCSFLNWLTRLVWMYTGNLEGLRIKEWDLSVVWVLQMNMEDDESARLDIDIFIQALEYFRGRVWLKEKMTWYDGFLRRGSCMFPFTKVSMR